MQYFKNGCAGSGKKFYMPAMQDEGCNIPAHYISACRKTYKCCA
jgi:hypothetical protein